MSNITEHILSDVLILDIEDTYENLSYKTISSFLWVRKFYPNVKYIVKIDDDVSMKWQYLLSFISNKYPYGMNQDIIECPSVMRHMPPWRRRNNTNADTIMSKW